MKKILLAVMALFVWAGAMAQQPRAEYPRPQMERTDWVNLNGEWTYTLDLVKTGWERNLMQSQGFDGKIIVPFAPESKLSGVAHTEFINAIWYQRTVQIPAAWQGKSVKLNFGAVYYESEIFIDGKFVGRHYGGSDSFSYDITAFVADGKAEFLFLFTNGIVYPRQTAFFAHFLACAFPVPAFTRLAEIQLQVLFLGHKY